MSNAVLPSPGTYSAKFNGPIVIYEAPTGSLCAAILIALVDSPVAWSGRYTTTLVTKEQVLQAKNIQTLRQITGWDGLNPFELMAMDLSQVIAEVVGEHELFTPDTAGSEPREVFKIKWLNAPGGGMPEAADAKKVMTKYAAKFKALAASAPVKSLSAPAPVAEKQAPALDATPAKKPAASGPPARRAAPKPAEDEERSLTADEVYTLLIAARPDVEPAQHEAVLGAVYWAKADELYPDGMDAMTPQDWGKVASALGV